MKEKEIWAINNHEHKNMALDSKENKDMIIMNSKSKKCV